MLALSRPREFAATISGFAAGGTIDLIDIAATGAAVNGADQLVISNGAATVATLQLSGDYTGATFSTSSDGQGGTSITVSSAPGASRPAASPAALHPFIAAAAASVGAAGGGAARLFCAPHAEELHGLLVAPRPQTA